MSFHASVPHGAPKYMSGFMRIIFIALTIVTGPFLVSIAQYEARFMPGLAYVLLLPIAFMISALFGYALVVVAPRNFEQLLRTCGATFVAGLILLPLIPFSIAVPFAMAADLQPLVFLVAGVGIAIAGLAVFTGILRSGVSKKLELSVFAAFAGLSFWLYPAFRLDAPPSPENLFGFWPEVIALVPVVLLAIRYAPARIGFVRGILLFAASVAPVYFLIAYKSLVAEDNFTDLRRAALWPVRFVTDASDDRNHVNYVDVITEYEEGEPIRIGEHWYRFDTSGSAKAMRNANMPEGRNARLSIRAKPNNFGLPGNMTEENRTVEVIISYAPIYGLRYVGGSENPRVVYEDVIVSMRRNRDNPGWPPNPVIEDALRKYIENARIPPPAENAAAN